MEKCKRNFIGERQINSVDILEDEKKKDTYNTTIKQGNFSMFLELSNELITINNRYLGQTSVDGIIFFYFYEIQQEGEQNISF